MAPAGEVDPGRRDLHQLGGPAPGPVQRLAQGPVAGGLPAGRGEEVGPLLGVEVEASADRVVEAHFGHGQHSTRKVLNWEARSGPCPADLAHAAGQMLNRIGKSVKRETVESW